jgi:GNAT superfamily N-acetyltransferase
MNNIVIREAKASEADQLTDLAKRSKAHWGYPQELIEKWHSELVVTPELIMSSISLVVEVDGQIKGFWCRTPKEGLSEGRYFIDPDSIRLGYGKLLWDAVIVKAKELKLKYLTWESDPNAVGFYLKMGARQIGTTNSNIVPGRVIPIMRYYF